MPQLIIYRVWSMHPQAHRPVMPSSLDEETVANLAESKPEVIYFFSDVDLNGDCPTTLRLSRS